MALNDEMDRLNGQEIPSDTAEPTVPAEDTPVAPVPAEEPAPISGAETENSSGDTSPAEEPTAPEAAPTAEEPAAEHPAPTEAPEEPPAEQPAPATVPEKAAPPEESWDGTLVNLNDPDEVDVDALLESFRQVTAEDQGLHLTTEQPVPDGAKPNPSAPAAPAQANEAAADNPGSTAASNLKAEEYLIDTPAYMGLEGSTPRKKRRKRHPHFFYYIAEAFRGIFSHGFMSFAAVGIITACLLIMGTFSLVALNVNNEINQLMDNNEFLAYVDEDYTEEEARALQSQIESIENVSEVTFITREEAYESYVDNLEDSSLYEDLDPDTVLRDRFSVKVDDLERIEETSEAVGNITGIVKLSIDLDVANGFVTVRNIVVLVAVVLVAILFIISLFIISNTIKLVTVSRKDEIAVMRMVGATNRFIRWPFIYQGAILGLVGAGIAFGLQTALYMGICNAIQSAGRSSFTLALIAFDELSLPLLAVFLVAGLIIGVCGSSMAIRKFLKV
ncbi:MAG: permease-like cell division protein FtsX [Oscillospiraceae bacterium]|nr:permease-like cell division protein FtsX [Oscillospiraceae bacterium]